MRGLARALAAAFLVPALAGGPALAQCAGTDLLTGPGADPALAPELAARSAGVANADGRFWKVDRWGTAPSYLLGTYHDTEATERAITAEMHAALAGAGRLVVEMSAEEQDRIAERMLADPDFAFDLSQPPLDQRIDPALLPQLETLLAERGLNLDTVRYMRPWVIFSVFGVPLCQQRAMAAGGRLMDQALMDEATAAGIPAVGLEKHEALIGAFERITGDDLAALVEETLRGLVAFDEEDMRRTAMNLYLAGHTYALWEFSQIMAERQGGDRALAERASRVMWEDVLVARNRAWTPGLVEALTAGNSFVAVGALHLPGPDGLVEILRREGWSVTRLD